MKHKYPTFTTEEFRERIRQLVGPRSEATREERPCVRTPEDRGYFPPTKPTNERKKQQ